MKSLLLILLAYAGCVSADQPSKYKNNIITIILENYPSLQNNINFFTFFTLYQRFLNSRGRRTRSEDENL